jgi:hypothetical protein
MATIDTYTSIDVNRVTAFPLTNAGLFDLAGPQAALYEGVEFQGPVGFDVSFGAPRQIPVVAQGQVQATFILPSIEARTGLLRCAYDSLALSAMLGGTIVDTIGTAKAVAEDTDKSGQETLVALFLQQLQAKDQDGALIWRSDIIPRATIVPSPTSYTADVMIKEYQIGMSRSSKRMWGETYTLATHGCTEATKDIGLSAYQMNIGVWVGDNIVTAFTLPAGKPANLQASAKVWDYATGAARAGAWNNGGVLSTTFTPSVKPGVNEVLVCVYEIG